MLPKPEHLGSEYADQFKDRSVAAVYRHRPPYPEETFQILAGLITDQPRHVLDAGCGTGDLARRLVMDVERVDAVDFSLAMLAYGRELPGAHHPHLKWIYGPIEEVALQPPYALITAGESLHWMSWEVVLPLFHDILTPHGYLAIAERGTENNPWRNSEIELIQRFSTNKAFRPYDLVQELEQRQLFQKVGESRTTPVPLTQSVEDYIQSIHSRNGFSYERMGEEAASAFDAEMRAVLTPFQQDGLLTLSLTAHITWGKPQTLQAA
ncbi:MAG: methyltransferase domain-containing protein [Ktedonobacteraceae bacterium]|nr:methyltransferase domain-containing protein [Ktedonobacteraceae bacterium]MBO0794734.1 methyltransferase domain-containing protein [Ktedonobacteraceae bacterium]